MRHKILQLVLSEDGFPIAGWVIVGGVVLSGFFRNRLWSAALWIVVLIAAIFGTFVAAFLLVVVGYAFRVLPAAAPFFLALVACVVVRPHRSAFAARTWAYTAAFLVAGFIVVMLPRPGGYRIPIAVFDSAGRPVPNASVSYSVLGGVGQNYDETALTDSAGRFTLIIYQWEWGELTVNSPSGTASFYYHPASMPNNPPKKIEFAADHIRRVIAANTNEVLDVHLKPK